MAKTDVTDDMRDPRTPDEVQIRSEARKPQQDPRCGVGPVALPPVQGTPRNRLVTIGDSLTHGFQSGAIFNTDLSWPRIVAWEMGSDRQFRYPRYDDPNGGMPFNLELLMQKLERGYGDVLDFWEVPRAIFDVVGTLAGLDAFWAKNWRAGVHPQAGIPHNLAVWGWDLRDCLHWNADKLAEYIGQNADAYWRNINVKSAWRVLEPARDKQGRALTVFQAAAELGSQGTTVDPAGPGIETLVIMLGSNNALSSIVKLGDPQWSQDNPSFRDMAAKKAYTVWRPSHFEQELNELVREVEKINAQHVIFATVPHVTIAPLARGVGGKAKKGSRYFPFYCRPWVKENEFKAHEDKHVTAVQARAIDAAIDQYNEAIERVVRAARKAGRDWYLLETAGLLDRLAQRRYIDDVDAQPSWWQEVGGKYVLPEALRKIAPELTSRFFGSSPQGRTTGGLFSLDGVHPTTVGYGVLAQEVISIMQQAGVKFYWGDDERVAREGRVEVDFERLLNLDSLLRQPPRSFSPDLSLLGVLDQRVDQLLRIFGAQLAWP